MLYPALTEQLTDPSLITPSAYIDGQWRSAEQGQTLAVNNPATGALLAQVADAGPTETQAAIASAERALTAWRSSSAKQRSVLLRRWYDLQLEHVEDLATIMTLEQGKPLAESRLEVAYGASFVEWFAEEAKRNYGDLIPSHNNNQRLITLKQAVGVVAAITPWNFPNAMITRKLAPALAAGCTVVLKPAHETPLSALALTELARRAGIPAGVINVIVGSDAAAIGRELTCSATVRKLSFTGSTVVGKALLRACADNVKKVSMELGGNAPLIVFADADIDQAVAGAVTSKYRNAGQTCICVNRILLQESIAAEFTTRFCRAVEQLQLGNGLNPQTTLGPLISSQAATKGHSLVNDAIAQGAQLLSGGQLSKQGDNFYPPTILDNVTADMRLCREEIFAPIAPLLTFKDEAEAITMANDTNAGLAAYLYSGNIGLTWRVAEALDYGMVGINEVGITSDAIPFGGIKESGLGREGSKYGLDDYTEIKYLCIGGIEQ